VSSAPARAMPAAAPEAGVRAAASARPWWRSLEVATAGLFVVLYLLPLGWRPLFVPDEIRYAEIPREMLASGDWVVPRLDGLRYFEKPALGYWLNALSIAAFGENRFAVRLPAALATGLTALVIAWLVAARTRDRRLAALAALAFLSCLAVAPIGTSAILDPFLCLFLTATLACFFEASASPPASRRERTLLVLAGVACGLAFLTKGFLAVAIAALVAAPYLVWQRRWRDLFRMAWAPAAAALLVALPWSLLIHWRESGFWSYFFWHEHVQRFLSARGAQHPEPWWFYLQAAPGLLLPWSLFIPAAAIGWRRAPLPEARDLFRFSLCWVVPPFVLFSASTGKLLTYVLPLFPAFAILVSLGLACCARSERPRAARAGAAAGAALFAVGAIALVAAPSSAERVVLFGSAWKLVAMAAALGLAAALLAVAARRAPRMDALLVVGLAPVALLLALQGALPERVLEVKAPGGFLARHRSEVTPETIVLSSSDTVRAACWTFRRDDVFLVESAGELAYGIANDESGGRLLDLGAAARLIERHRGHVVLVARPSKYDYWRPLLPPPVSEDRQGSGGYVFVRY